MVIVLKAQLQASAHNQKEVRRLVITTFVANNFIALWEQLVKLFPVLKEKKFEVAWIDNEDDRIIISSDAELAQAMACCDGEILKIYVNIKPEGDSTDGSTSKEGAVHKGVVCDGCQKGVVGFRYKCLQCHDFDLCSECNNRGEHPEHDMLKLASAANNPHPWYFPGWRRLWQSVFGHMDGNMTIPPHFGGGTGCPYRKNREQSKAPCDKGDGKNEQAEVLKNIGEHVAHFLKPFGYDIAVDVIQEDKLKFQEAKPNKSPESPKKSSEASAKENNESSNPEEPKEDAVASNSVERSEEPISSVNPVESPVEESSAKSVEPPKQEAKVNEGAGTSSNDTGTRPKTTGLFYPLLTEDSPLHQTLLEAAKALDDWTMINHPIVEGNGKNQKDEEAETKPKCPIEDDSKAEKTPATPEESLTDASPKTEDIPSNLSPPVLSALRNMLAMGFTNEGGWLSRLLIAKDGNISDALDSIYRR